MTNRVEVFSLIRQIEKKKILQGPYSDVCYKIAPATHHHNPPTELIYLNIQNFSVKKKLCNLYPN